jgi:hypothetical protein
MIYFDKKFLKIEYLEDIHAGIGNWDGFVSENDYKEGLNKMIDFYVEKKVNKWIANLTKMEAISPELQDWANNDWFPRALQAGVKYMAVIVPEDVFNQFAVENIMTKAGDALTTHYFHKVDDAKEWIKQF